MGFFEKFKNKNAAQTNQTPADAKTAQELGQLTREAENIGLPPVNRKKNDNKIITIAGFVFIIFIAGVLIVAVNKDKAPTPKKNPKQEAQVANKLPQLVVPAAPQQLIFPASAALAASVPTTAAQGVKVPAIGLERGAPTLPIPLQGMEKAGKGPAPVNGKSASDWFDRKMGGALLVSGQSSAAGQNSAPAQIAPADSDSQNMSLVGTSGKSAANELSSRFEPTTTKNVTASLLADRNFLLTKGTSLDCALETAIDSTVPGLTTCRLTRDVYSDNGQILLLDRGSQLVGEYQGGMKQGQVRLFVLWTRAKTPNGVTVSLNSPGTDSLGRSGLSGWVDDHFMQRFGAAILMSFIKDSITNLTNKDTSGTINNYGNTVNGGEKIVEKILESTVNIPPTIIKNQGDHIQIMVARDLDFSTVYGLRVKQ